MSLDPLPAKPGNSKSAHGPTVGSRPVGRPIWKLAWYNFLHVVCRLLAVGCLGFRCSGRENLPKRGALLVLSNHQSHLDPVLIGLTLDRRLNFLARETLFGFAPFRSLILSLDAIPIDREGLGLSGLKETLARLRRGEAVVIFPEGTRSPDGELQPIKPGFCALARRADVTLLPLAIRGAHQVWPKGQLFPWPGRVEVVVERPISPAEVKELDDQALIALVQSRLAAARYGPLFPGREQPQATAAVGGELSLANQWFVI